MFTGLVESLAPLARVDDEPPGKRLVVDAGELARTAALGESVALDGCCLTVVQIDGPRLHFQAGPETLAKTSLGQRRAGDRVNLERSLRLGDRLGGHLVTGHVDAVGAVAGREDRGEWSLFWFSAPKELLAGIVPKGSVAVDGVSLTVVETSGAGFSVQLIPHTLAVTTLGGKRAGDLVNLETDLLGKYVAAQVASWKRPLGD